MNTFFRRLGCFCFVLLTLPYCVSAERYDNVSVSDLLTRLERMRDESPNWKYGGELQSSPEYIFTNHFVAASRRVNAETLPRLIAVYETAKLYEEPRAKLFTHAARAVLRVEFDKLTRDIPVPVAFVAVEVPPPKKKVSEELQSARAAYLAAIAPVMEKLDYRNPKTQTTFQMPSVNPSAFQIQVPHMNQSAFVKLQGDLLANRDGPWADRLCRHIVEDWPGWATDAMVPREMALFLALLRERRFEEATGLAFRYPRDGSLWWGREGIEPTKVELLKRCGLDWEKLFLGALYDFEDDESKILLSDVRNYRLHMLSLHASEKAVPPLMELAQVAVPKKDQRAYLAALAKFVTPTKSVKTREGYYPFDMDVRKDAPPVSEATQRDVLAFFQKIAADPQARPENVKAVAILLHKLQRPETKESLRELLEYPSQAVADNAARALNAMGESATAPAVPKPQSTRFLLLNNGEPIKNQEVNCIAKHAEGERYVEGTTDAEGTLVLERSFFKNPDYTPTSISFHSKWYGEKSLENALFHVTMDAPSDWDAVIPVAVETMPLTLTLLPSRPREFYNDKQVRVHLCSTKVSDRATGTWTFPFAETLTIPFLQPREYTLILTLPSTVKVEQKITHPQHPQTEPLKIPLATGTDLKIKVIPPGRWYPEAVKFAYFKEGEPQDKERYRDASLYPYSFQGIPIGRYVLKIPGSREQREFDRRHYKSASDEDFTAVEIPFTVNENSPEEINLGEIRLK